MVSQGFQEALKPQSDSPTAAKESFKLLMALSANFHFKLASVDIRAAFLQSKVLDRDVFVEPPSDIKRQGIIWKLRKPLYGLDDASQNFGSGLEMHFLTNCISKQLKETRHSIIEMLMVISMEQFLLTSMILKSQARMTL